VASTGKIKRVMFQISKSSRGTLNILIDEAELTIYQINSNFFFSQETDCWNSFLWQHNTDKAHQ